jgi:hypothetical protein
MLARNLDIYTFGEALIKTGDLDPVYLSIYNAHLPEPQLVRLLLAYFLFYSLGAAAWLSEQENYWTAMERAAENKEPSPLGGRWPRGTERRYFRGPKSVRAIQTLGKSSPEEVFAPLRNANSLASVAAIVGSWPLCGPWISFKVADVLERVMAFPVEFPSDTCMMYKEPRAGLEMLSADQSFETEDRTLAGVYGTLTKRFRHFKAPPRYERFCNAQESETVICKYHSMAHGFYHVGKDIHEVRHGLKGWGSTASLLLDKTPPEVKPSGVLF